MTSESSAPKNIRVSTLANETCDYLRDQNLFEDSVDAYRAAVCLALALGLDPAKDVKLDINKWDTASVFRDPACNIESLLILSGIDGDSAIVTGMNLAEAGLRFLNERRIANADLLSILVGKPANDS